MALLCSKQHVYVSHAFTHLSFTLILLKRMRSRVTVQVSRACPGCVVCVSVSGLIPDPRERSRVWWEGEGAETSWAEPVVIHLFPIWFCQKDHIAPLVHPPFLSCPFFLFYIPSSSSCAQSHICVCVCLHGWVHLTEHDRIVDGFCLLCTSHFLGCSSVPKHGELHITT